MNFEDQPLEIQAAYTLATMLNMTEVTVRAEKPDASDEIKLAAAFAEAAGPAIYAQAEELVKKIKEDPCLGEIFRAIKRSGLEKLGISPEAAEVAAMS
jgi:hypothetical protein